MGTRRDLAFSALFGLMTFILPLPLGGVEWFAQVGRAALLLGLLLGQFVIVASDIKVSILERMLSKRKGRRFAMALFVLGVLSIGGYITMKNTINLPKGWVLYVELLLYGISQLLLGFLMWVTGSGVKKSFKGEDPQALGQRQLSSGADEAD